MSAIYISKITDFIYVSRAPLYEADQRALIAQGFQCVVNLQEAPDDFSVHRHPIETIHIPIRALPRMPHQMQDVLSVLRQNELAQQKTLVHCSDGLGRSGLVLACYLAAVKSFDTFSRCSDPSVLAMNAIDELRRIRPGSVETDELYVQNCVEHLLKAQSLHTPIIEPSKPMEEEPTEPTEPTPPVSVSVSPTAQRTWRKRTKRKAKKKFSLTQKTMHHRPPPVDHHSNRSVAQNHSKNPVATTELVERAMIDELRQSFAGKQRF